MTRNARVLHLIGPGGAGKTSAGQILAERLGWQFVDLDQCFMACAGDLARFIAEQRYDGYARFRSDAAPEDIASDLEDFVRRQV